MKAEKIKNPCPWRFVEKYYPGYAHVDQIAHAGDLQKLLDGEIDGCAEELLRDEYGGDENNDQIEHDYNAVHVDVYERAMEGYLDVHNEMVAVVNKIKFPMDLAELEKCVLQLKELLNHTEA